MPVRRRRTTALVATALAPSASAAEVPLSGYEFLYEEAYTHSWPLPGAPPPGKTSPPA